MKVAVGANSDVGRVRHANEDRYMADAPVFAVADGMGGHLAGDVASRTAVEVLTERWSEIGTNVPHSLVDAVKAANSSIYAKASADDAMHGMGTTCTLMLLSDGTAHFAHVGDSRAYLYRDDALEQLTEDHTLVERMIREGRLPRENAAQHPQRSVITRALGVDEDVEIDVFSHEVRAGDRLLLCSDGLTSMVAHGDISEVLASEQDPEQASRRLIAMANDAGGEDNITVVLIDILSDNPGGPVVLAPPAPAPERQQTAPDAIPREDVGAAPVSEPAEPSSSPRRAVRRTVAVLLVLAALAAGAWVAARLALANSWYVGVGQTGHVTIFQGRPETILGLDLGDPTERTDLLLDELPPFVRDDLHAGIAAESLPDAQRKVESLRSLARDSEFAQPSPEQDVHRSPKRP